MSERRRDEEEEKEEEGVSRCVCLIVSLKSKREIMTPRRKVENDPSH